MLCTTAVATVLFLSTVHCTVITSLPGHVEQRDIVSFNGKYCVPAPTYGTETAPIVGLVTAARLKEATMRAQTRDAEYQLGLDYMFSRLHTVVGAVTTPGLGPGQKWPLIEAYPWSKLTYYSSQLWSKGQRETEGIRQLLRALDADGPIVHPWLLNNDTIIVKLSGRYQPVRDNVLQTVLAHPEADVWGRTCGYFTQSVDEDGRLGEIFFPPGADALMSFFFAMRLGHFRELYLGATGLADRHNDDASVGVKGAYLVEFAISSYIYRMGVRLHNMTNLGVIANVDGIGILRLY